MSSTADFEVAGTIEALAMAAKGKYLERYGITGRVIFEIMTELEAITQVDEGMDIKETVFVKATHSYYDHVHNRYRKIK